jgi:hypothetical protein
MTLCAFWQQIFKITSLRYKIIKYKILHKNVIPNTETNSALV